jgi:hypothetical protein
VHAPTGGVTSGPGQQDHLRAGAEAADDAESREREGATTPFVREEVLAKFRASKPPALATSQVASEPSVTGDTEELPSVVSRSELGPANIEVGIEIGRVEPISMRGAVLRPALDEEDRTQPFARELRPDELYTAPKGNAAAAEPSVVIEDEPQAPPPPLPPPNSANAMPRGMPAPRSRAPLHEPEESIIIEDAGPASMGHSGHRGALAHGGISTTPNSPTMPRMAAAVAGPESDAAAFGPSSQRHPDSTRDTVPPMSAPFSGPFLGPSQATPAAAQNAVTFGRALPPHRAPEPTMQLQAYQDAPRPGRRVGLWLLLLLAIAAVAIGAFFLVSRGQALLH